MGDEPADVPLGEKPAAVSVGEEARDRGEESAPAPSLRPSYRPVASETTQPPHSGDEKSRRRGGKFEVYEDKAGKFRFRLKASNGQIVANGEAFATKAAALRGAEAAIRAAQTAPAVPEAEIGDWS